MTLDYDESDELDTFVQTANPTPDVDFGWDE